jgi:hypothetical protein
MVVATTPDDEDFTEPTEPTIEGKDDETTMVVVGGTEDELKGKAPETVNLVDSIPEDEQEEIGEYCFDRFTSDWDSSDKFRQKRAEILKLALGEMPPGEDDHAQIHYSIIMKAVVKLAARVYDQQFPSNGEFFGVKPTSAADLPRSVRVAKHMNWQILHQIPEYVPNHDALIMQWYLYGSAFTFMYWNPVLNRPCHEICPTEDIVLPYAYPQFANDPSMSGLPRITRILRKYRFGADGIDAWAKTGYYSQTNVDSLFDGDDDEDDSSSEEEDTSSNSTRDVADKAVGLRRPQTEKPARRELLEMHCWWQLDEWDESKPVIITIDRTTKKLLNFVLRADEDPEDRARYNREKQANDAQYEAAMQQYEQDMQAYMANSIGVLGGPAQLPGPPLPGATTIGQTPMPGGPPTMTQPPVPGAMTPSVPVEPIAPKRAADPAPPKLVPIHFFTHFICIPNPEGIYGFGVGMLLMGQNIIADCMGSYLADAAKLANTITAIASRESKLGAGEWRIKMGEINKTDLLPGEIETAIKFLTFPKPEPMLAEIITAMQQDAVELSGAGDIMSGEVGGSNETATTTQIRISQALAAVSIQNKRYTRSRTEEGRKLARMNSVYLGDTEYFSVIDPFHNAPQEPTDTYLPGHGVMRQETISRTDYLEDVAITVTADPRMASQPQRFQEAVQAIQTFTQIAPMVPALQQNVNFWNALGRNVAMAMDRPELVAALNSQPMPPPPPAPPPGALPPHTASAAAPKGQPSAHSPPAGPLHPVPSKVAMVPGGGPFDVQNGSVPAPLPT